MPYRSSAYAGPCLVCGQLTPTVCRRCGRPICAKHAEDLTFYVPTLQCADADLCDPPARRYRKHERYELDKIFDYGKPISNFFGL